MDFTINSGNTLSEYDLNVVYDDDDSAVWNNLDFCELSKIHLHYHRKAGVTWASTE